MLQDEGKPSLEHPGIFQAGLGWRDWGPSGQAVGEPCTSPSPCSPCLPLQIPSQPHSRQPGCPLPALSSQAPPGCGVRCRLPRSSEPRHFRMHRRGRERSKREKSPRETPALGRTGRRGPAEPGESRKALLPLLLPSNGGMGPARSGEDRVSRSLPLGEHQYQRKKKKKRFYIYKKKY